MKRTIIESPYAGRSPWRVIAFVQRWRNRRYARACVRDSLLRGEAPIASHLLYTQRGILRDGVPTERTQGIAAGLSWLRRADNTVVYVDRGISAGMRYGIAAAEGMFVHVIYRALTVEGGLRAVAADPLRDVEFCGEVGSLDWKMFWGMAAEIRRKHREGELAKSPSLRARAEQLRANQQDGHQPALHVAPGEPPSGGSAGQPA